MNIQEIVQALDQATDDQIREVHEALHTEAFKRGIRLSLHQPKRSSAWDEGSGFKSIEKL